MTPLAVEDELRARAANARSWLMEAAFPLWAAAGGIDGVGFLEALDLNGTPIDAPTARVRVQSRQAYFFCVAARLGWRRERACALTDLGVKSLTSFCRRDDGLYGLEVALGEGLSNETASLYDSAFALLAFASALAICENGAARAAGVAVAETLERSMWRPPSEGGCFESLPPPARRAQNPHMHYFEALMAWSRATGDAASLQRAGDIKAFVEQTFVTEADGLVEFAGDVDPADNRLEAGHHYEWTWLLSEYDRMSGCDSAALRNRLYDRAIALTERDGRIALMHNLDGTVRNETRRAWVLTEALKAHLIQFERGLAPAGEAAVKTFDVLWADHLADAPAGGWIDQRDGAGGATAKDIPASTGYHIALAFSELMRVAAA